jgi:hypothetical protein
MKKPKSETKSLPSVARIVLAPSQVPALALEDHRQMESAAISGDGLDDGNQLAVSAFDFTHDLLILVDKHMSLVGNAQLNALGTTSQNGRGNECMG